MSLSICAKLCWRWRCRGEALAGRRTSPRRGRPRLRAGAGGASGTLSSAASMADCAAGAARGHWRLSAHRAFARFDGGAVATDVPDQLIPKMLPDEGFMHPFGQACFSELLEGAREGRLRRQLLAQREATDSPRAARSMLRRSISAAVVVSPSTVLDTKAFASQARSWGGRPTPHHDAAVNSSIRTHSRVWMTFSSFGVSVPTWSRNSGSSSC